MIKLDTPPLLRYTSDIAETGRMFTKSKTYIVKRKLSGDCFILDDQGKPFIVNDKSDWERYFEASYTGDIVGIVECSVVPTHISHHFTMGKAYVLLKSKEVLFLFDDKYNSVNVTQHQLQEFFRLLRPTAEFSEQDKAKTGGMTTVKTGERIRPPQYQHGIDTMQRAEANMTPEGCLAAAVFNIDKYNWRDKKQDRRDFEKIIDYANWAIFIIDNLMDE